MFELLRTIANEQALAENWKDVVRGVETRTGDARVTLDAMDVDDPDFQEWLSSHGVIMTRAETPDEYHFAGRKEVLEKMIDKFWEGGDEDYLKTLIEEELLVEAVGRKPVRIWRRRGKKLKKVFRCIIGRRKGKAVSSLKTCAKPRKPAALRQKLRVSAKRTRAIRKVKSRISRRQAVHKRLRRLNAAIRGKRI